MDFDHPANFDARGGTFNNVHHDQHNNTTINVQIYFTLFGSKQTPHNVPLSSSNDQSRPKLSQGKASVTSPHSSDTTSVINIAVGLIVQITDLLIDRRDRSNNRRDLSHELKSLQQTLTLTGLAIRAYEESPLGHCLAHAIAPEISRCCGVLRELLDRVHNTWLGLDLTTIGELWRPVWWGRWDGDELVSLKNKLSVVRKSFERVLMALHSYVYSSLTHYHPLNNHSMII